MIGEKVAWFEGESDPALNSNVYQTANQIIVKHFPGESRPQLITTAYSTAK